MDERDERADDVVVPMIEEVMGLADAVDDRWRAVVVTLACPGLRIGELLGLQVHDVDFLRQTIRVERQRTQDGRLSQPKSASSVSTVPVGGATSSPQPSSQEAPRASRFGQFLATPRPSSRSRSTRTFG